MKIKVFLAFALLLVAGGWLFLSLETRAEWSPVSRGRALAIEAGCVACHAESELEPRVNFRELEGVYMSRGLPTIWEDGVSGAELVKEWIRDGVPAKQKAKHSQLLIQMPAYGEHFVEDEIEALAAWVLAKGFSLDGGARSMDIDLPEYAEGSQLSREELIVFGDRLSRQQACYQCHGEYGQGGIPNPDSFKGYVPGFFGEEFRELTDGGDRSEIAHWIDHGRGLEIESGWLGWLSKKYFDGQAIGMPAYESAMSEREKTLLVDFVLLLNEMGPLGSSEIESINRLIAERLESEG